MFDPQLQPTVEQLSNNLSGEKQKFLDRTKALIQARDLQDQEALIVSELSKSLREYDDSKLPLLPGFTQHFINNYLNNVNKKDRHISAIFFNELIYAHKNNINDFSAISDKVLLNGQTPIPQAWKNTPEIYARATEVSRQKVYIDKHGNSQTIDVEPKIHPYSHNNSLALAGLSDAKPNTVHQDADVWISEDMALTLGAKFENPFILDPANRLHVGGGIYAGYGTLEEVIFFCSNMGLRLEELVDLTYFYHTKSNCIKVSYKVPLTHDLNSDNLYSYYAQGVTIFAQADTMEESKEHRHKLSKPYKAGIGILAGFDMRIFSGSGEASESDRALFILPNGKINWEEFKQGTKEKYRHEIEVARFYRHDSLVLCMLTCGAFLGNDNPSMVKQMVAEALAELVVEYKSCFKNMVISIPGEWDKELRDIVNIALVKAYADRASKNITPRTTTTTTSATLTTTTSTSTSTLTASSSSSSANLAPSGRESDPEVRIRDFFKATEKLNTIKLGISFDSEKNLSLKLHDLNKEKQEIIHNLCQRIPGIFHSKNGNDISLLVPGNKVNLFENYLRMLRPQYFRGITSSIALKLLENPDYPKEMPIIQFNNGLLSIQYPHHPESNKSAMNYAAIGHFLKSIGLKEEHVIVLFDVNSAQLPDDYVLAKMGEMQTELENSVKEKREMDISFLTPLFKQFAAAVTDPALALSSLESMYQDYLRYFKQNKNTSKSDPTVILKLQETYVTIWEKYRLSNEHNIYWNPENSKLLEYKDNKEGFFSFLNTPKSSASMMKINNIMENDRQKQLQPVKPIPSPKQ
jgi:hypothetical protein